MKRLGIALICVLLLILPLTLSIIRAQGEASGDSLGLLTPEQIEGSTVKLTSSWDYLSKEWKTILLGNPIVKEADSFFQQINPVFFILFASDYSFSLKLLLVIILWVFVLFLLYTFFKYYTSFSKIVSFGMSFLIAIMFAHVKLIEMPVNALIWFFFGEKPWWIKLIIGVIILAILMAVFMFLKKFGKQIKENRKKRKDELNSLKLEVQTKAGESVTEAFSKFQQK